MMSRLLLIVAVFVVGGAAGGAARWWLSLHQQQQEERERSWSKSPLGALVAGPSSAHKSPSDDPSNILTTQPSTTSRSLPPWNEIDPSTYAYDDYLAAIPDKMVGSTREYHKRKALFDYNLERIRRHNVNQRHDNNHNDREGGHVLGLNEFMDLLDHELPRRGYDKSQHAAWQRNPIDDQLLTVSDASTSTTTTNSGGSREIDYWSLLDELTFSSSEELPKSVDWRIDPKTGQPLATPVKEQGRCGSCWAFATTAALESHVAMRAPNQTLLSLSMQELVSCVPNPNHCGGKGGCMGSTAELAIDFIHVKGMVDEWHFGYQSHDTSGHVTVKCSLPDDEDSTSNHVNKYFDHAVATVSGYAKLPTNNYTALMHAVAKKGPVIVNVACDPWHFYESGVFTPRGHNVGQTDINHVVVLMGYGTDETTGEDYWLVRNSWGPKWGEQGYIRLKRVDPASLPQPDADCGMDVRPADGVACTEGDDDDGHHHRKHHHITPPAFKVCGTSGILFDPVLPIGARML